MKRKKKLTLHQKIHHHLTRHFHRHVHKVLHVANHLHHNVFHVLELIIISTITLTWFGFTNLTGLSQDLYRANSSEVAQALLSAMENPGVSLKQWNIISIWNMDTTVENTFAKWYCTYWAARISPEFFPYIDENTQQRTWWGNAVDRCKNASDTWYKIWSIPSQWALVVYDAWGKFWSYGHVGKVLHYDASLKKIIVRDMARVARSTMSDRREDLTTAQVKCYIYNSKTTTTTTNTTIPVVITNTGTTTNTETTSTTNTNTATNISTSTSTTNTTIPSSNTSPTTPPNNNSTTTVVTTPSIQQDSIDKQISLHFENLSDIAEHFMTQNDVVVTLVSKSPLKLGEVATLTLEISNKKTGEKYSGLLPFSFTLLSTNDILESNISNIQMIKNGSVDITILAQSMWTATIVIYMDDKKIGETNFSVQ